MASSEVTRLDLTIVETDVIRGAGEVLKVIRPHWRSDSVRFKVCIWRICAITVGGHGMGGSVVGGAYCVRLSV